MTDNNDDDNANDDDETVNECYV